MIVQLQAEQISIYWDSIRHAAIQACEVTKAAEEDFARELLQDLLLQKAQAWIGSLDDKSFYAACVTCVQQDPTTRAKVLFVQAVYAWKQVPETIRSEWLSAMQNFARNVGCTKIVTHIKDERLQREAIQRGMKQDLTHFIAEV